MAGYNGYSRGWLILLAGFMSGVSFADSFRLPYQSAAAAGQGMAYAAQADDPSAIFYNPAGMSQLHGIQASFGVSFAGGDIEYTSPAGAKYYGDLSEDFASPPPSNFYLTANLQDLGIDALGPLTVGLGLTTPYGLITRYPDAIPFSSVVSRAKLPMLDIKPTLSYRVSDWLSIGLGADIYTFADFLGAGGFEQQTIIPGVGKTQLRADGTMASYNASLLLTPLTTAEGKPRLNLGFVFRAGGGFPLEGDYQVNNLTIAKARTALNLPDIYTGAIAYWPIRDQKHEWKLEYDMDFSRWNDMRTLNVQLSNGLSIKTPANWRTAYSADVGTEFKWLNPDFLRGWSVALRAGYNRSEKAIPNDTYNPAIPESRINAITVGFGADCHKGGKFLGILACGQGSGLRPESIGIDVAFQAYLMEPRKVTNNINPSVIGTYNTTLYVGSMNIHMAY